MITFDARRTKFLIDGVGADDTDQDQTVLIRTDRVSVRAILDTDSIGTIPSDNAIFVSAASAGRTYLQMYRIVDERWEFGELINGAFGVWWEYVAGFSSHEALLLMFMPDSGGDEWQLA